MLGCFFLPSILYYRCLTLLEGIEVCYACAVIYIYIYIYIYFFFWGGGGIYFIIIKMASVFKLPDVYVCVCVWGGGGGGRRNNVFY